MGIKLYKIVNQSELNNLVDQIEEGLRWNVDNTECIVEFTSIPNNMDGILTYEEILLIGNEYPWMWDTGS